jgi:predicted RNA-binding Zn ribbon-like protein
MKKIRTIEELPIDSTKLCCNFVNTVYSWTGDDHYDFLNDYNSFIDWCVKLEVFEPELLSSLRAYSKKEPDRAGRALKKIIQLRLLIRDLVSALADNRRSKIVSFLTELNPIIAEALSHLTLDYSRGSFMPGYQTEPLNLMSPTWVILKSLYDMVTNGDTARIKECPSCGWVFYDETKNGKRRWCNPLSCGTKDKMDRYTQKLKNQNK